MTMFRVPGDFPSVQLALESPLVQRGDSILVKDGPYNQVVVVPYDKDGIKVVEEGEPAEAVEETVPVDHVPSTPPDGSEPDKDRDEQPAAEPSTPEEADDTAQPGQELPQPTVEASGPVDPPDLRPNIEEVVPVTRSSIQIIRVERASPYWVTVHRRTLELCAPEKGRRWNPPFWMTSR